MANEIAKLDSARQALAEVSTAAQAKKIADIAKAAEIYALKQGSKEAADYAHQIHADALRLEGDFLNSQEKAQGAKGSGSNQHKRVLRSPCETAPPTLAQQGITKRESTQAQAVAAIAKSEPKVFDDFRAGKIPLKAIVRAQQQKHQKQAAKLQMSEGFTDDLLTLTGQKFGCIYADPPWQYSNQGTRASTDKHYSTMTVDELCKLPIKDLSASQAHLHLWTTNAFLFECPRIFDAWGFEFKSSFIWVKEQIGIGNYWRNSHEFLLLGVRGGLVGQNKSLKSWLMSSRGRHSSKPDQVRLFVEKLSPGPRLELFGRRVVPGWTVFGNEITEML